ncbi:MAG: TetR/AcrR family transcriptional regulator [Proteobacteria bacterium]|nr:TetR/AcrR family transcriptional regulator [Pseudomonadota bacterium]
MVNTIFDQLRQQEKENRRFAIVDVAEKILHDKGLEAVTIRNVAKMAGLSSGSMYMYFKNKEELLLCMLVQNLKVLKKDMDTCMDNQNPMEAIKKMAYHYKSYFIRFGKYINILSFTIREDSGFNNLNPEMVKELKDILSKLLALVQETLSAPPMKGALKGLPPERCVPVLWALIQGLVQITIPAPTPEDTFFDFDQLLEDVTHILI